MLVEIDITQEKIPAVFLIDMQSVFLGKVTNPYLLLNQIRILRLCAKNDIPVVAFEFEFDTALPRRVYYQHTIVKGLLLELLDIQRLAIIFKADPDGFYKTGLNDILLALGTKTILLMGLASDACVWFTAESARNAGYKVITSWDVMDGRRVPWYEQQEILYNLKQCRRIDQQLPSNILAP